MNATDRLSLDAVAIPANADGSLALCCAIRDGDDWRTAWLIGTGKHAFGPACPTAKAVARASLYLNETRAAR